MTYRLIIGDVRTELADLPDQSVQMCVTSPPYFGLRDYGHEGQIGLESTVEDYVAELVAVFREVRRALRDDGTLWLNLGDSYASAWPCSRRNIVGEGSMENGKREARPPRMPDGLKEKDLIGVPWRVAFALQADGWWLRQDIIWHKPNPMPESVRDRCTKSHEYIFLLSKSPRYYYDAEAIAEPSVVDISGPRFGGNKYGDSDDPSHNTKSGNVYTSNGKRNKRDVWSITTRGYKGAHFAVFPPDLPELCIKAGSKKGDTVLDPFSGSGTTIAVAESLGRDSVGIDVNPSSITMTEDRVAKITQPQPARKPRKPRTVVSQRRALDDDIPDSMQLRLCVD